MAVATPLKKIFFFFVIHIKNKTMGKIPFLKP